MIGICQFGERNGRRFRRAPDGLVRNWGLGVVSPLLVAVSQDDLAARQYITIGPNIGGREPGAPDGKVMSLGGRHVTWQAARVYPDANGVTLYTGPTVTQLMEPGHWSRGSRFRVPPARAVCTRRAG